MIINEIYFDNLLSKIGCVSHSTRVQKFANSDSKDPRAPSIERARRDQPKNIYLD
jgi:hypothetical protein